jgi:hypothetical protein
MKYVTGQICHLDIRKGSEQTDTAQKLSISSQ